MKLHVGAQAARVCVGFAAHWADVGSTVGVAVHVALQVMFELETAAAGGAAVDRAAAYEHSRMRGASQM